MPHAAREAQLLDSNPVWDRRHNLGKCGLELGCPFAVTSTAVDHGHGIDWE